VLDRDAFVRLDVPKVEMMPAYERLLMAPETG
jgi:hypothetical protein